LQHIVYPQDAAILTGHLCQQLTFLFHVFLLELKNCLPNQSLPCRALPNRD
jgi:hypothetical protein